MRSFMLYTPHPIVCGSKIKKNKLGGACCAEGGGEKRVSGFGGET
jgi:hypothetical protein